MDTEKIIDNAIAECIKQVNDKYPDDMALKDTYADGFLSGVKWLQLYIADQIKTAQIIKSN
jgi:hypothetical protein